MSYLGEQKDSIRRHQLFLLEQLLGRLRVLLSVTRLVCLMEILSVTEKELQWEKV